jgi:hypothetical protein
MRSQTQPARGRPHALGSHQLVFSFTLLSSGRGSLCNSYTNPGSAVRVLFGLLWIQWFLYLDLELINY